ASIEFFQANNSDGFRSYVSALYGQLLERTPTDSELQNGIQQLEAGTSREAYIEGLNAPDLSEAERQEVFQAMLGRAATFEDTFEFDSANRQTLLVSIMSSDAYYARHSMPTSASVIRTQKTTEYKAVGVVGDATGGIASGTLIAPQFVLVAAHTVADLPPGQITFTIDGTEHHIEKRYVHEDFDRSVAGTDDGNDIAILKLQSPVSGVEPAKLTGTAPRLGGILNLVGFGQHEGALFGTKREGSTPPVSSVTQNVFSWLQSSSTQNDADPGDSGAPVFSTVNNEPVVVGIVSGGTGASGEVGDTGVNTRVDSYLTWIQNITGDLQVSDSPDAPTLLFDESEYYFDENAGEQQLRFVANAKDAITFSVTSSNPDLFDDLKVTFDEGQYTGSLDFTTKLNAAGSADITITAEAGGLTTESILKVNVEQYNANPTINLPNFLFIDAGTGQQLIELAGISAGLGETESVRVTVTESAPNLFFVDTAIDPVDGDESRRMLKFTPSSIAVGPASLTIEVRDPGDDGQFDTADDLIETVVQNIRSTLNKAPLLDAVLPHQILLQEHTIDLGGIADGDGGLSPVRLVAESDNDDVVVASVTYDPANPSLAQLTLTPSQLGSATITITVYDSGDDGEASGANSDDRWVSRTFQVSVVEALTPWHNEEKPSDVSGDTHLSPIDALLVVDYLNRQAKSGDSLPVRNEVTAPFYDVNKDGQASPLDALLVITELNQRTASGEGEYAEHSAGSLIEDLFAYGTPPIGAEKVSDELADHQHNESLPLPVREAFGGRFAEASPTASLVQQPVDSIDLWNEITVAENDELVSTFEWEPDTVSEAIESLF
ncbi:MAG: trypsin-like serine protease, partial [Planctomycetota bacterium]